MSEKAESSDDGAGRRAFCFELVPYPLCSPPPTHSWFSPFEPRGSEGISPAKTCIAFYCQIDCLNNSQRGNPRPTTHSTVYAFSSCPLFLLFPCITTPRVFNYVIRSVLLLLLPYAQFIYALARENGPQLIGLK